ncbi:MAG: Dihydrolipoyllysine-residue acetyltransferase component of pyruvate dehydrogenase complex [Gemmatimonadaceae bacterium]|nr:Dihydrolipoyllysine-residue acetyltransferase component of pyruvate dehydrogenase complex [Gemmatimonadaceae bacterium]
MPQMGESIAEGTLSKWLKKVGDAVKRDEPIFEISTDKVDAEIPAPNSGILAEVLVAEGQTVPIETIVARIETDAAVAATMSSSTDAARESVGSDAKGDAPIEGSGAPPPVRESTPLQPAPRHQNLAPIISPLPAAGTLEARPRTNSSPLVRRIAADHGIELSALAGTGLAGRVTKKDLLQFIEAGRPSASIVLPAQPASGDYQIPVVEPWPGDTVESMTRIRRITAEHMVYSKRTSAHVTSVFELDLTRATKVRNALRPEFDARGEKLTYLPFVVQAVVRGLQQFPVLNAAVRGSDIVFRKTYNIGIAVAVDWGLIVPVIKGADNLSLAGLTRALNDLASRARTKRLKPEDVQDATFTITNPGVFGSQWGTPVIPQPTVAILGTGTIEKRPKVIVGPDGDDVIAIRTCAYFALSFDHRIVDGADADRFMAFVKVQLENVPDAGF